MQMKNIYSVIDWFKTLQNKESLSFIIFDVVNHYPSIFKITFTFFRPVSTIMTLLTELRFLFPHH